MKKIYSAAVIAAMAMLASCGDSNSGSDSPKDDGSAEVTITTSVQTRADVTNDFADNDVMNVYGKAYNSVSSDDKFSRVKAELRNGVWAISPAMRLKENELVFVYAAAPYNEAATNPAAFPVDIAKQQDILYSGSGVGANFSSPSVKLTMKHALAMVSLNIAGTDGANLSSISISGEKVYSKATLNIENGKFTGTSTDQYTMPTAAKISPNGWKSQLPRMWVVPFSSKESDVQLTAVIDGKTYTVLFPEVEMKNGTHYIFRLMFGQNGLEFDPSKTEVISLNDAADNEFGNAEAHGIMRFTVNAAKWQIPVFEGHGVFGRVKAGNNSFSYKPSEMQSVTLTPGTPTAVNIETWNANTVEIESISGITEIDFTQF